MAQPSSTLFVQNLDESLKKDDLKRVVYQLFSTHGKVIDVVILSGARMRGSAHVVFRDLQGAAQASRWLDGSGLLGRELRISYAKGRSHATIKQDAGEEVLYLVKMGLKDPDTLQDISDPAKGGRMLVSGAQASNIARRKADEAAAKKRAREDEEESEEESDDEAGPSEAKKVKANGKPTEDDEESAMEEDSDEEGPTGPSAAAAASAVAAGAAPIAIEEPGPVLFLSGLPTEASEDVMSVLFQQYPGFGSVRLVPGTAGIAFVQYDATSQAQVAKTALDGFLIAPGYNMAVGFAR